jgi:hypothetical protein
MSSLRAAAIALIVALGVARAARADEYSSLLTLIYGGIAAAALDVGFTGGDVGFAIRDRRPPLWYSGAEILVAGSQLGLGVYMIRNGIPSSSNTAPWSPSGGSSFIKAWAVWMGALTAHGIWELARSLTASHPPPERTSLRPTSALEAQLPRRLAVEWSLGPTMVALSGRESLGCGVSGRF